MRVLASRQYFVYLIGCSETRTDSARLMRLFSTALDTTLTAFAAERRRACCTASASRLQLSIHISRLQGALSSKPAGLPLLLSIDGTDRRTDGRPTVTCTYPAAHTMRAVSATQLQPQTLTLTPNSSNYTVFLNTVENTLYFPR